MNWTRLWAGGYASGPYFIQRHGSIFGKRVWVLFYSRKLPRPGLSAPVQFHVGTYETLADAKAAADRGETGLDQ